jgi:hypothetical protein
MAQTRRGHLVQRCPWCRKSFERLDTHLRGRGPCARAAAATNTVQPSQASTTGSASGPGERPEAFWRSEAADDPTVQAEPRDQADLEPGRPVQLEGVDGAKWWWTYDPAWDRGATYPSAQLVGHGGAMHTHLHLHGHDWRPHGRLPERWGGHTAVWHSHLHLHDGDHQAHTAKRDLDARRVRWLIEHDQLAPAEAAELLERARRGATPTAEVVLDLLDG